MAASGASLIEPFYFLSASVALALALFFPATKGVAPGAARKQYYLLQGITILGAVVGAKISALMGDYHWPQHAVEDWTVLLKSGRSITGALIGGFVAAETAKPFVKYTLPPNDRFAALLPFSIAIGRVGCALTGCCLGAPHFGAFSVTYADGIARYPVQLVEAAFHFLTGLLFIYLVKQRLLFGRLFAFYLVLYGAFRFVTEPIRATPKDWAGYSAYQWLSLGMILLGTGFLTKRTFWPPPHWPLHPKTA